MPANAKDQLLDAWLEYQEPVPADAFILEVMRRVRREQRRRHLILCLCGLVGVGFGLAGALLLAGPVAGFFSQLPVIGTMQAVLLAVAAMAFYVWSMNEDLGLSG